MFQSTPPRGGRRVRSTPIAWTASSFNPRPRAGGDCQWIRSTVGIRKFQSTPPRGGRRCTLAISYGVAWFQSTPPRGGRLAVIVLRKIAARSFNPRPRAGGDVEAR